MTDLTCHDLASRVTELLALLRFPIQPIDDPAEAAAVTFMDSRGSAELYVQQHLLWALDQLGDTASDGDPVRDARIALGGWGRLQQLQGGAE